MATPTTHPSTGRHALGQPESAHQPILIDERSQPGFRSHFVRAALGARAVDVAIERMRLDGVDLGRRELGHLTRIRVILANAEADVLLWEARRLRSHPDRAAGLRFLIARLQRGTLSLRSCPLAGWSPDFSVFHRPTEAPIALLGHHWFQRPYPFRGPAFASIHRGPGALRAAARFEELWSDSHDIGGAIQELLLPFQGPQSGASRQMRPTS
jgi:hypothetical protein